MLCNHKNNNNNNQNQEVKQYRYFKEGSDSCNMRIVEK